MKLKIILTSCNINALLSFARYIELIGKKLNIDCIYSVQPNKIKKLTLLKSPHVYKKAKESFEIKTHKIALYLDAEKAKNLYFTNHLNLICSNKPHSIKVCISTSNTKKTN